MKTQLEIELMWNRIATVAQRDGDTEVSDAIKDTIRWVLGEDDDSIEVYLED